MQSVGRNEGRNAVRDARQEGRVGATGVWVWVWVWVWVCVHALCRE